MKTMLRLSYIECGHLLSLLKHNAEEGSYWGNREHYWKRHQRLVDALEGKSVPSGNEKQPVALSKPK